jgi:hypothetical protein
MAIEILLADLSAHPEAAQFAMLLPWTLGGTVLLTLLLGLWCWGRRRVATSYRLGWLSASLYLAWLAAVIGLGLTSYLPLLAGGPMQHWALLMHLMLAGAFVGLLVLLALLFNPIRTGWPTAGRRTWWLPQLLLWMLLVSGLGTAGSMLAGMMPWLDTEGLERAVQIHRYAGLVAFASSLLYGVCLAAGRPPRLESS